MGSTQIIILLFSEGTYFLMGLALGPIALECEQKKNVMMMSYSLGELLRDARGQPFPVHVVRPNLHCWITDLFGIGKINLLCCSRSRQQKGHLPPRHVQSSSFSLAEDTRLTG